MDRIRVKFLENYSVKAWLRQFPSGSPCWSHCDFLFDVESSAYDWLVVYNDFPASHCWEDLSCDPNKTILVTMEPPSIKSYGKFYSKQFNYVLTAQPAWALPHKNRIFSQTALQWFYGRSDKEMVSYDELKSSPALRKNKNLSTVCSTKQQRHTLHNRRYRFTQELKSRIPEMDIYGHGVIEMDDKAEALAPYRYHLAIENYIGLHHWTEKLADVFLGCALPLYCGCPNAADYFPEESFIQIDISDVADSSEIIKKAIRDNEYEKRLPYILEARRRVMEDYNMFAVLSHLIESLESGLNVSDCSGGRILSRRLLRKRRPFVAVSDFFEKTGVRIRQQINFK